MAERLAQVLSDLGLSADGAPPLARYGALLLEKNRVMNLTGLDTADEVVSLHMADCAALCAHFPLAGRLLDVGTGAGFPGLVAAILCPRLEVTLLDPLQKRLDFLGEVAADLGLQNVTLLHGRGEELGHAPELREGFSWVTARAVARLNVLAELCLPFAAPGGAFLAMKARESEAEWQEALSTIEALGGKALPPWDYPVWGDGAVHRVYPVEKAAPTPARYPRRWAKIAQGKGIA